MGTLLNSYDTLLSQNGSQSPLVRMISQTTTAPTAATTSCGYVTASMAPRTFTVPTLGGSVTAAYMTDFAAVVNGNATLVCAAKRVTLGSIDLSTGTFTSGSSMPTNTIEGSSIQTASLLPMAVVTAALTATTPVITTTYTNQGGTGSKSCAITLPTNAGLNSAFLLTPHLASADTGVQAVSNITKSAGTVGTLTVYGLLPLAFASGSQAGVVGKIDPLTTPWPMFPLSANDVIAFFLFNSIANDLHVMFALQGDN